MPQYRCAVQQQIEGQQMGESEVNQRTFDAVQGKQCQFFVAKVEQPEILDFSKGECVVVKDEPKPEPPQEQHKETPTPTVHDATLLRMSMEKNIPIEELEAAEKRMFEAIAKKGALPPMVSREMDFKQQVKDETRQMLETFTWDENMMIAFVPLIISKVAWVYAEKVLAYCAEHRISEYKKLGRVVKMLRQEYIDTLCKDLDRRHVRHIETQTEQFMDEINHHLTILWLQANTYIKNAAGYDMTHDTMRTDAMVAILMVRYLKAHDNKMNAIIEAKMGHSESITNPQMVDLEGLMKAYLPKGFVVGTNYQLDLCAKIFENSLAKIEFDITD